MGGIRELLSIQVPSPRVRVANEELDNAPTFLEKKNITFPGVVVAAGLIVNFAAGAIPQWKFFIAMVVGLAFGLFITINGITDPKNKNERRGEQWFVGVVNSILLVITIYGVSSIPAPGAGADS